MDFHPGRFSHPVTLIAGAPICLLAVIPKRPLAVRQLSSFAGANLRVSFFQHWERLGGEGLLERRPLTRMRDFSTRLEMTLKGCLTARRSLGVMEKQTRTRRSSRHRANLSKEQGPGGASRPGLVQVQKRCRSSSCCTPEAPRCDVPRNTRGSRPACPSVA